MPSKSLISSAERGVPFREAATLMEKHIERLSKGSQEGLEKEDFDIFIGTASFTEEKQLAILSADGSQTQIMGKRYVLATGSESLVPPIKGLDTIAPELFFTSEGLVSKRHVKQLPESVFILGGGPIGLEMMTALSHFGVSVTIAERGERLISRLDPEFGAEMKRALEADPHVTLLIGANLIEVKEVESGIACVVERAGKEETHKAGKLLLAVGRKPCIASLGLEHMGVALDERGRIIYDQATLQTKNPDIYIAGDMTGTYQILHYAALMGSVAGMNAASGEPKERVDYAKNNMGVIFSDPQIAHVGMTEADAEKADMPVVSVTIELPAIGRGILEDRQFGLWKIIAEKQTGRIVGGQALSPLPHSEWFADTVSWIMHFGGTAHDVAQKTPYYHPTYPELFQTLGRELVRKLTV